MENNQIPFYIRILLIIGIGVALAVALDNVVSGIGVAMAFSAAFAVIRNKPTENSGEHNE